MKNKKKKIAIMQPYFLPYLGYFQLINAVDKFILYDELTFIKDAWMNRNRIMIKNQKPSFISVPLVKKSSNRKIKDVMIASSSSWQENILNSLFLNYKKAEYFKEVFPFFDQLFKKDFDTLSELNAYSIEKISRRISIDTEISVYPVYDNLEKELMEKYMSPETAEPQKKVRRVFKIAEVEKADIFINPIGGQLLYSKEEFKKNKLGLCFLEMEDFEYPQFSKEFYPSLSIVDVLMHNGWNGTSKLLNKYQLK